MFKMKKTAILIAILAMPAAIWGQESLSLEQCRKLALEHNHKIKIARSQSDAASALKKAAFAQYLPNFSINGTYSYINKDYQLLKNDLFLPIVPYTAIDASTGQLNQAALKDPAVAASTFVINPATGQVVTDASGNPVFQKYTYLPASKSKIAIDNMYLLNGGFTQPIYMGGKIRQANKIAGYARDIADSQVALTEDEVVWQVDESYWRIVSLREKVTLAEKYSSMLNQLVQDLTNIRKEGIITGNDLLKAEVKLSEAGLMYLKAKNGMELSKMALCQMCGIAYSPLLSFTDTLNNQLVATEYTVNESEIAGRQELRILEKNIQIASAGEKLMLSRYLPNVALSAGYTFMNPNPYRGLANEFGSDYNVGLVLNVPIFHFGDKKHTLDAARAEHSAAVEKLDETRELLVLQLQQAVYRYNESANKTTYASLALKQAADNLKLTEDNFSEGILKTTDLLEAQVMWQKAWSELIDAQTEQQLALSNLKKTTGKH
jgi:outer membrane protein